MIGFVKRVLWAKFLYFNIPYGGFIGKSPPNSVFESLIRNFARKENVTRIRIVDSPMMKPTEKGSFHILETRTHILNLKDKKPDCLLDEFKSTIRRDVRKAIRNDVTVETANNLEDRNAFYQLYLDSMDRNHAVPKYGRIFIEAVFQNIINADKGHILLAKKNKIDTPIAGILIVNSDNISHYLMAGSRTDTLKYCPNDLLIFEAIKRSILRGNEYFDFLPSGIDDHALERFKMKWGAEPYPVDTMEIILRPIRMKLWDIAYRTTETEPVRHFLHWFQNRQEKSL